jgi:hypothetical protein
VRDVRLLIETLCLTPSSDSAALAVAWSRADTKALVHLVDYEGAALWLQRRFKSLGITLAGEAGDALAASARHAVAHSLRVESEAVATLGVFEAAGISVVPLKGAAMRRIAARVPYADARAPNDVDVLVRNEDVQRAWNALVARGYAPPKEHGPDDGHHLPALAGPLGVGVEIHMTTSPSVSPDEAWHRATCDGAMADLHGTMRPIPGDTELLWHAATHAVAHLEEVGRAAARLRYWLDAVALIAADAPIDWSRIRDRLDARESANPRLVRAWIRTASDLSGRPLPATALGDDADAALDVERMLSWRLYVFARHASAPRWAKRLLEEGVRGEAGLPHEPTDHSAALYARVRHTLASRAARVWWRIRR